MTSTHEQGERNGRERPEPSKQPEQPEQPEQGGGSGKSRQAASFGAAAGAYERGRPPYPPEAAAWLVPDAARTVVDLGAGTGKLTRALRAPGRELVAVEPSAGMRKEFARVLPGVRVLAGTAEAIPLPAAGADAVVCAQAWHWVDPARAVPEAARVLRPGGRLALVWNSRDESVPWVAELGRILRDHAAAPAEDRQADRVGAPFGPVERRDLRWRHPVSADGIVDMVTSRSYVITLAPAVRARLLDRVRALLAAERPAAMPYVTECHRAHR